MKLEIATEKIEYFKKKHTNKFKFGAKITNQQGRMTLAKIWYTYLRPFSLIKNANSGRDELHIEFQQLLTSWYQKARDSN